MKPLFFEVEPGVWVNLQLVQWASMQADGKKFWVVYGDDHYLTVQGDNVPELWARLQDKLRSLAAEEAQL